MKRTESNLDAKQILSVIEKYSLALDLVDDYDSGIQTRRKRNDDQYHHELYCVVKSSKINHI